eukprot:gene27319-biopygen8575
MGKVLSFAFNMEITSQLEESLGKGVTMLRKRLGMRRKILHGERDHRLLSHQLNPGSEQGWNREATYHHQFSMCHIYERRSSTS